MRCSLCSEDLDQLDDSRPLIAASGLRADLAPAFCPRCGWPLGHGEAQLWPREGVTVAAGQTARVSVFISSDGDGVLYYSIDPDPRLRPEAVPELHGCIPAGSRAEVRFRITETGSGPLSLTVYTLSARPERAGDARTVAVEQLWVAQSLAIPLTSRTNGPVTTDAEHLLFGLDLDEQYLNVNNWGGTPLEVDFRCGPGFMVSASPTASFLSKGSFSLPPSRPSATTGPLASVVPLRIRRTSETSGPVSTLSLRPAGLPELQVTLEPMAPAPTPLAEHRYCVGIDFGTSKTAVAIVDQYQTPPRTRVLEWDRPRGDDRRWLPSAVYYDRQYSQALFGDQALAQADGAGLNDLAVRLSQKGRAELPQGTLFVGMKMALHGEPVTDDEPDPPIHRVVVDYFRYLFSSICATGGVDLREAKVVLSLPVLDSHEAYKRQERRTLAAAAEAGEKLGLTPDRIVTEREPVCAAMDLVRLHADTHALNHGDWLCVFDCGAGTTDISLMQVAQLGDEWRFPVIHPLGYEWGGDGIDQWIFMQLLGRWCSPDDPSNPPASGPVGVHPASEEVMEDQPAIDLDAGSRQDPDSLAPRRDWMGIMLAQDAYRFDGARLTVTKAELLHQVRIFKEEYLNVFSTRSREGLDTGDPIAELGPERLGNGSHWTPLSIDELAKNIALEFENIRGCDGRPLYAALPQLMRSLDLFALRSLLVCPVGGGTLVAGWHEAVQRPRLGLNGGQILEAEPALRRLHVARGAAQKLLFRVTAPLPEDAQLQVLLGQPGGPASLLEERHLSAGTAPGEASGLAFTTALQLTAESSLLLRVRLGPRLLREKILTTSMARRVLEAESVTGPTAAVTVDLSLRYLDAPRRLVLGGRWNIGDGQELDPVEIRLPAV